MECSVLRGNPSHIICSHSLLASVMLYWLLRMINDYSFSQGILLTAFPQDHQVLHWSAPVITVSGSWCVAAAAQELLSQQRHQDGHHGGGRGASQCGQEQPHQQSEAQQVLWCWCHAGVHQVRLAGGVLARSCKISLRVWLTSLFLCSGWIDGIRISNVEFVVGSLSWLLIWSL